MPRDDIQTLYERVEAELRARQTLPDGAPPPAPVAVPPRPTPKTETLPPDSAVGPDHGGEPSTFPASEAPTKLARRQRQNTPRPLPSLPVSEAELLRAKKKMREWHPPGWLVALAKWVAPPIMLSMMAAAYWIQAKVALLKEEAAELSQARQKQKKALAECRGTESALARADALLEAEKAARAREKILCEQQTVKPPELTVRRKKVEP